MSAPPLPVATHPRPETETSYLLDQRVDCEGKGRSGRFSKSQASLVTESASGNSMALAWGRHRTCRAGATKDFTFGSNCANVPRSNSRHAQTTLSEALVR
jgi:hypothetical protein